jgi:hypothetical protein
MQVLLVIAAPPLMYLIGGFLLWPGIYVSESSVVEAVGKQGYSEIIVVDKDVLFVGWSGCSGSDDASFELVATNALGKRVELVACAGWPFKGVTVRTE